MKKLVKRIINRLKAKKTNNVIDINGGLIANGTLKVGENSDIHALVIYSHNFNTEVPNVIIGNDCQILGQIELQSKDAQVIIGDRVYLSPGTKIFCRKKVEIGNDVMISWGCTILDTNFHSLKSNERKNDVLDGKKGWTYLQWNGVVDVPVFIKEKSWVGFNSIITKGVTLEEGTVVACGSVVTKSSEKFSVIGGNPAVFIKKTE